MEDRRFRVESRAQCLGDVAFVVLLGLLMLAFSPLLVAVAAAFVPACLGVAAVSARRVAGHAKEHTALRSRLARTFLEAAAAPETVRSLDLGDRLAGRFARLDAGAAALRLRLELWRRLSAQAVELLQRLALLVVMLVGVGRVIDGHLTLGQYVAFNLLCMQLTGPFLRLAAYRRARSDHSAAEAARRELLGQCRAAAWRQAGALGRDFPAGEAVRLEARNLSIGHDGRAVVDGLDVDLAGGCWLAVSGPSGCGKTSLLQVLAGLRDPQGGTVRLNGTPAADYAWSAWACHVRLVPQQARVFSDSLAGNLMLGNAAATPQEMLAVAEMCGLSPLLGTLPAHLNTIVGDGGLALSGGERQRLCIARAVLSRPRVLLLDEATSALDAAAEAALLGQLRAYLPEAAVVLVSHREAALARCDRVLDLGPGQPTAAPSRRRLALRS